MLPASILRQTLPPALSPLAYLVEFDPQRTPVVWTSVHNPERIVLTEDVFLGTLMSDVFLLLAQRMGGDALTIASQSAFKSPKSTRSWRIGGRTRVSMLGSVAGILLSSVSCFKRSVTVVWTFNGRVLRSKIGSHRLVLTAPWTHNMLGNSFLEKVWRL